MAAKERHKQKVKQRIQERLEAINTQEEILHSIIREYVQKAQTRAQDLLAIEDTTYFMQQYGSVEQLLDRVNNTCELLSTTAEDMIENAELDVSVKPDSSLFTSSLQLTQHAEKISAGQDSEQALQTKIIPRTSAPESSLTYKANEEIKKTVTGQGASHKGTKDEIHQFSPSDKSQFWKKDEEIKRSLEAMLHPKSEDSTAASKQERPKDAKTMKTASLYIRNQTFPLNENIDGKPKKFHQNGASTNGKQRVMRTIPSPVKRTIASYIGENVIDKNKVNCGNIEPGANFERNTSTPVDDNVASFEPIIEQDETIEDNIHDKVLGDRQLSKTGNSSKSVNSFDLGNDLSLPKTCSIASSYKPDKVTSKANSDNRIMGESSNKVNLNLAGQVDTNMTKSAETRETIDAELLQIEKSTLPSGKMSPVIVSDIGSPWCFCVQFNPAEVNHLMEQICTYMSQLGLHKEPLKDPQKGQFCLAKFSKDTTFYRAFILQSFDSLKEVEVLFIDYGNRERVKNLDLRELPQKFYSIPMQAVCCSLAEIHIKYKSGVKSVLVTDEQFRKIAKVIFYNRNVEQGILNILMECCPEKITNSMCTLVAKECKQLSKQQSECVLNDKSMNGIVNFNWDLLEHILKTEAPNTTKVITAMASDVMLSSLDMKIKQQVMFSTGILLHARNRNMTTLQYMIGFILLHGGCTHRDIERLSRLGVCVVPKTLKKKLKSWQENLDSELLEVRDGWAEGCQKTYQLIGDNWDKNIVPSYRTSQDKTLSLHLFNIIGVVDRIQVKTTDIESAKIQSIDNLSVTDFIPSLDDQESLITELTFLVATAVIQNLDQINELMGGIYPDHLQHKYSDQAGLKTVQFSLGLFDCDERKTQDVIKLMKHLSERFVPQKDGKIAEEVFFGGDRLTDERFQCAQKAMENSCTSLERLEGFISKIEDFHRLMNFLEAMPNNKYMLWTEEDSFVFRQYVMNQQLNCIQACKCSTPGVPLIVRLYGSYPIPAMPGGSVIFNQMVIGEMLVSRGSAKYVNTVDQIGHLQKSGEGKDESLILNKSISQGSVVEIHEPTSVALDKNMPGDRGEHKPLADSDKNLQKINDLDKTKMTSSAIYTEKLKNEQFLNNEQSDRLSEAKEESVRSKSPIYTWDTGKDTNSEVDSLGNRSVDTVNIENKSDASTLKADMDSVNCKVNEDTEVNENTEALMQTEQSTTTSMAEEKPHKVATERTGYADSETMSSAGTTDMDSERSTDTGFQSTEVTFDLHLDPQGEKVMLAHIKSPSHFYVHVLQAGSTLDLLMRSLNKHFEKMNRRKLTRLSQTFVPVINKLCCAQFLQDNNFYRALILNIRSDTEPGVGKVNVHYIDFGDREWLPKRRLFPLPPHYSSVPPLAIRCKLAYIKPLDLDDNVQTESTDYKWSESCTQAFVDLAGFEKVLHMQVVEGHLTSDNKGELVGNDNETLGVYLVDTSGTEEVCANMDLIRQSHAALDVPAIRKGCREENANEELDLDDWNPMEADFLSKRNSYKVDTEDVEMATLGYKSQPHKGICRYFSKGAKCWRGESCPYRHVQSDSVVPLEREEVYCVDKQILPKVNSWVAAEVMTILTPGHFYIHLPMGSKSLDGISTDSGQDENANTESQETLDDLLIALNDEYSKKSVHDRNPQLRASGEIVVARFSQDKQWYRARVIKVSEDKVKVFYLDFGNTEWIPEEEVAEIMPEFLHLPFQAVECFLCNVEPAEDENWSPEAKGAFRSLVDGKTLVAHIRSRFWSGSLSVDLYDTSGDDDINIGDRLIQDDHAVKSISLTDSSCNASFSSRSELTNSEFSEIFVPG